MISHYESRVPYVGIAHDLLRDPLTMMRKMNRSSDKLLTFKFFGAPSFMVTHPESVREVLVTKARFFRKADAEMALMGRFMGKGLVTNNDHAFHKQQRKLAQPAFHMQRITAYADVIVDYTQAMLDEWHVGEVRDLRREMTDLTMFIVSKTLFDADRDSLSDSARKIGAAIESFQDVTDSNFGLPIPLPAWVPTKRNRLFRRSKAYVDATLLEMIQQRRESGEDKGDLLSMLLAAQDEQGGGMDDAQLLDEVITLFAAGHETTSNALMWTWYLLSTHPDVMQRLRAEVTAVLGERNPTLTDLGNLPFVEMVIKEAMRLYPPVYSLNGRMANEDVEILGERIPKNSYVMVSPYGMHHDPRFFADPERFDPERFSAENEPAIPKYAYIPFGAGPRVCIGNNFAMMEAQLILATMARQLSLEILPAQSIDYLPQITLSNKTGMHMRIVAQRRAGFGRVVAVP
jgi:cytochrome P450